MKRTNLIWLSLLALILTACQDEDFGYTKSEIYQSYIDRKYAEEFAKAFPNVDPNHTWMCTPDTIYHEVEVPGMTRAAGDAPQSVERKQDGSYANMAYSDVSNVLNYMKEADDNYSNHKASLNFEYKAVEDVEDGCEVYTITPTFWGRKFTDHNAVGIYYIKADGSKVDMGTFWDDYDNRDLYAIYKDGARELVPVTDQQIVDSPESNWARSYPLTHPCRGEATAVFIKDQYNSTNNEASTTTKDDMTVYKVVNNKTDGDVYDTQLFLKSNTSWSNGTKYTLTFKYKVSRNVSGIGVQYQNGVTNYVGYDSNKINLTQSNDWQTVTFTSSITGGNANVIALDLNNKAYGTTYYFKDISWHINNIQCQHNCDKDRKIGVESYDLPQYTLKVPVGTTWGVYLQTDLKQNQTTNRGNAKWYSGAEHNWDNADGSGTKVEAAATFTFENVTYVSFEDAPTKCPFSSGVDPKNPNGTGDCTLCHRGHFDHDYNDIVLTITPRPVTKTYRTVSYRVMCEDLGGTFDWDFNDVVYDVIYTDGKTSSEMATIDIKLQAVGGTLPIYMKYNNSILTKNGDSNGVSELHKWSTDQKPDSKGLYVPVNVVCDQYDVEWTNAEKDKRAITLKTIPLEKQKYTEADNFDLRDYVGNIVIEVEQSSDNTTHEVRFPVAPIENGNNSSIPQCFMTSTGTEWANELQPIYNKYTNFKAWVSDCGTVTNWWNVEIGY